VSIFAMVNPIGMAPVFLEKTKDQPLRVQRLCVGVDR
jgi:small neutral amino acid transporter SnatA (MarC family)